MQKPASKNPLQKPFILEKVFLFEGVPAEELEAVAKAAKHRAVKRGQFFFHQNQEAKTFFLLKEGRVKLIQETPEGHQVLIRLIGPGEIFGGVSLFGDTQYPATAQAIENSAAFSWDAKGLTELMKRFPAITVNAMKHMAERLREIQDRYRELATEQVERRVARTLLRLVRFAGRKVENGVLIDIRLSRQDLAEMTGTTLYTVSRILNHWKKADILTLGRLRVLVRKPHSLVSIAEDL